MKVVRLKTLELDVVKKNRRWLMGRYGSSIDRDHSAGLLLSGNRRVGENERQW